MSSDLPLDLQCEVFDLYTAQTRLNLSHKRQDFYALKFILSMSVSPSFFLSIEGDYFLHEAKQKQYLIIATPADVSLLMQLGVDGVFVGSGIFKSAEPEKRAKAMAAAVTYYNKPEKLAELSTDLGPAMSGPTYRGDKYNNKYNSNSNETKHGFKAVSIVE